VGTTDPRLARQVLDALAAAGIEFALLHGAKALQSGEAFSDLDTVVDRPPEQVISACLQGWEQMGLRPVILWAYDIGGTKTVFLTTSDASSGVQLDLLFDPTGRGKYGVRSSRLLGHVEHLDDGLPVVSEPARLIYLFQKRRRKAQSERVEGMLARARTLDRAILAEVSRDVTGSTDILDGLDGEIRPLPRRPAIAHLGRAVQRIRRPVGFWAHVEEQGIAKEAARRFGAFLAASGAGLLPNRIARCSWYLREVAPVRLRAGVFVSWGSSQDGWPAPDVVVARTDAESSIGEIVSAMARRVVACVS